MMSVDYLDYLRISWEYFPYFFYTFVFLTFLPKSLGKIKAFAAADYEANRYKYHRCYGPEQCCHTLIEQVLPKPKQRKAVTRIYPKRQTGTDQNKDAAIPFKRPLATTILSANHVNEMAKMFESGTTSQRRKINRVPPTILPEAFNSYSVHNGVEEQESRSATTIMNKKYSTQQQQQQQHHDTFEKAAKLLSQMTVAEQKNTNWSNEPSEPITLQKQQQQQQLPQQRPALTMLSLPDVDSSNESSITHESTDTSPMDGGCSLDFPPATLRRVVQLNLQTSLEDIFAAIARNAESNNGSECECDPLKKFSNCQSLSPVTSIDDILSQRRLSRPLSAYSISDLLNEESSQSQYLDGGEALVESMLRSMNKT